MADNNVKQAILDTMASIVTEDQFQKNKQNVTLIMEKLEELSNLFDLSPQGVYENKSTYYSAYEGWNSILYRIKSVNNYTLALHLITEILDLIRGEPLIIEVYKIERDAENNITSMKKYIKKESELALQQRKIKYGKSFHEEIHYLQSSLEEQEIVDKAFIKHYETFERLAKQNFQKHKGEKRYTNFNEGHIIEAYQRHLIWDRDTDYRDPITKKKVAIMLYYSMNSTGWWKSGDVGYTQIKGDNTRLATQKSIRMVANKLIQMYQNPETFTPEEFQKMFTSNELDEIADYEKLSKRTLNDLLATNLKTLNKNNIEVTFESNKS